MAKNGILKKVDHAVCRYLGIKSEETTPTAVKIVNGKLLVTSVSSYKRHAITEPWETFKLFNFNKISADNRKKLGIAVGKVIASDLVVSFDELDIKSTCHDDE